MSTDRSKFRDLLRKWGIESRKNGKWIASLDLQSFLFIYEGMKSHKPWKKITVPKYRPKLLPIANEIYIEKAFLFKAKGEKK